MLAHPSLPVLATSGIDNSIKIWEPLSDRESTMNIKVVKKVVKMSFKSFHISKFLSKFLHYEYDIQIQLLILEINLNFK